MCFDYDETCEVYSEAVRAARKKHRCAGCGSPILPKQLYLNTKGIFDGHAFSGHYCGVCEAMRQRIHEHEIAEGCPQWSSWIAPEDIAEWVENEEFKTGVPYVLPSIDDGQKFLEKKRADHKAEKAKYAMQSAAKDDEGGGE